MGALRETESKLAEAFGEIKALRAHKEVVICKLTPPSPAVHQPLSTSLPTQKQGHQDELCKLREELRALRQGYEDQER